MSITLTNLSRGAFTTTSGTVLYTANNTGYTIFNNAQITNSGTSAITFNLNIVISGYPNGVPLQLSTSIAAGGYLTIATKQVLTSGQSITGNASATSATYQINGVVIS